MSVGTELELAIYAFVELAGKGQPRTAGLVDLTRLVEGSDQVDVVDALMRLYNRGFIALDKWVEAERRFVPFSEFRSKSHFFYEAPFGDPRIQVTEEGRADMEKRQGEVAASGRDPQGIRSDILRVIADHEKTGTNTLIDANEIAERLGLRPMEVSRHLDILAHQGKITSSKSHTSYPVRLEPPGWEHLEAADRERQTPVLGRVPAETSVPQVKDCEFHPEIEKVSGRLYRDGHFKQAALEAYIRVINEVKAVAGLQLDGDQLMNRSFGIDHQTPRIQFNDLQTDADKDEQKGFMFLYKGLVGLRNSKAHSNRLLDDPTRAHDYLALASLLMRVLEIRKTTDPSQ